jgi:hypothetical protein
MCNCDTRNVESLGGDFPRHGKSLINLGRGGRGERKECVRTATSHKKTASRGVVGSRLAVVFWVVTSGFLLLPNLLRRGLT